jgi:hypothetical protein
MGIFRSNTVDKQIIDAVVSRDKLVARLRDTEIGIADARAIAERIAVDGDDSQLDAAEARTRVLVDRSQTLRAALAKVESEIADLERARDEDADKAQRERTASEVELLARAVVEGAEAVAAAVTKLHESAVRASVIVPEAAGLAAFAQMAKGEIPESGILISRLLREHRECVLRGEGSPKLAEPPQPYIEVLPPVAPTETLFALRSIKWRDDAGKQRSSGQFTDVELPPRAAARALQSGACTRLDDPRRRMNRTQGVPPPKLDGCLDLDLDEAPPPEPERASGELHSAFETVIGPARVLKIAR